MSCRFSPIIEHVLIAPDRLMTTPTFLVTLLIYALAIGAAALLDSAWGTGNDTATAIAFGITLHAPLHLGHLTRESRKLK